MSRSHIVSIHNLTVYYGKIYNGFKNDFKNEQRACEDKNIAQSFTIWYLQTFRVSLWGYSTSIFHCCWLGGRLLVGRMSIEDEARMGRPVSIANDKNILEQSALIEDLNVKIADAVGISTRTAQAIVMSIVFKFFQSRLPITGIFGLQICLIRPTDNARVRKIGRRKDSLNLTK